MCLTTQSHFSGGTFLGDVEIVGGFDNRINFTDGETTWGTIQGATGDIIAIAVTPEDGEIQIKAESGAVRLNGEGVYLGGGLDTVYWNNREISLGPVNSGGTGFRVLRVPNNP